MKFYENILFLIVSIKIVNGGFFSEIWPKPDYKMEVNDVKYLYACYPDESAICGRALSFSVIESQTITCYDEVKFKKFIFLFI